MKYLQLLLGICFFSDLAIAGGLAAGGFLQTGVYYYSNERMYQDTSSQSQNKSTQTNLNLTLGYSSGSSLLLGLKYISLVYKMDNSSQNQSKINSLGIGVGFYSDGLYVMLSSLAISSPEYKITTGQNEDIYYDGSGMVIDLAYYMELGKWLIGPQISWQSFEYKKHKSQGQIDLTFVKQETTEIQPYLSFCLGF